MAMDICGYIYMSQDIKTFSFKCISCETDTGEWNDFFMHIQTFHNRAEEWVDPLEVSVEENIEEDITKSCTIEMKMSPASSDNRNQFDNDDETADPTFSLAQNNNDDGDFYSSGTETETDSKGNSNSKFKPSFFRRHTNTATFIEEYKSVPCLWNENDENYQNNALVSEAQQKIIDTMRAKCNVSLNVRTLNSALKRIRRQYSQVLGMKQKQNARITCVALAYFEQCDFLSDFVEAGEDLDSEKLGSKNLFFGKHSDFSIAFIEAYKSFPVLYDINHKDNNNIHVRKVAYEDMAKMLETKHSTVFNKDDLYKGIHYLRQWYYKNKERLKKKTRKDKRSSTVEISEVQQMYLEMCSFLPPKIEKRKLACEVCGAIYQNEITLQVHLFKIHQIGEWPFKCRECDRTFEHKSLLTMHEKRIHVGKVHQCDFCERQFAVIADSQRHLRTHTGEKPFVCELCGKAFASRTQLGYHSDAIHTKTRAFKCNMCPKDFLKRRDLRDHIKAHLNIRDKICETCGKGFTNCHSLIRHRQIHSEVKKFTCKLCDAKFHQFVGLNAHMKRTHGIVKGQKAT